MSTRDRSFLFVLVVVAAVLFSYLGPDPEEEPFRFTDPAVIHSASGIVHVSFLEDPFEDDAQRVAIYLDDRVSELWQVIERPAQFDVRVVLATVRGELRVLDLVGAAARTLGLTQEIAATTDYAACQLWARALYGNYPQAHGIRWRGRQSGSMCVVFHDRAEMDRLEGDSWSVTDPEVWPRIARAARDCRLAIL